MFSILNKFMRKKSENSDLQPPHEELRASVLSHTMQNKVDAIKPKIELSSVLVDRNKWALFSLFISVTGMICSVGWYHASERFANHVRVAYVKLDASGDHHVSLYDENSRPTFFMNTVYSSLSHYTERRFSKIPFTIKEDYGFVAQFMSPALKNNFFNEYHAARIAADFEGCRTCLHTKMTVRTVQHDESDQVILNNTAGMVYRSTVFARATSLNPDGTELGSVNQIITLVWRFTDISVLPDNISSIEANPIGIEILSESLKTDPTSVPETKL